MYKTRKRYGGDSILPGSTNRKVTAKLKTKYQLFSVNINKVFQIGNETPDPSRSELKSRLANLPDANHIRWAIKGLDEKSLSNESGKVKLQSLGKTMKDALNKLNEKQINIKRIKDIYNGLSTKDKIEAVELYLYWKYYIILGKPESNQIWKDMKADEPIKHPSILQRNGQI